MLPSVPSPTTPPPQPRHLRPSTFSSAGNRQPADPISGGRPRERFPRGSWLGLRTALAGSPVGVAESGSRCGFNTSHCYGPVVHLRQLPTPCCHDAVAFGHRRVNVPPDGDFHPAVWAPSQAHECGVFQRRFSCPPLRKAAVNRAHSRRFATFTPPSTRNAYGVRRLPAALFVQPPTRKAAVNRTPSRR